MLDDATLTNLVTELVESKVSGDTARGGRALQQVWGCPQDVFATLCALARIIVEPALELSRLRYPDDLDRRVTVNMVPLDGAGPVGDESLIAAAVIAAVANDDHHGAWLLLQPVTPAEFSEVFARVLEYASTVARAKGTR